MLIELVDQDVGRRRQHDLHDHIGRIGLERQQRRQEVLRRAVERLIAVLDIGRLLLEHVTDQLGETHAVVRVLREREHILGAHGRDRLRGGDGDTAVEVARIEDLRIALLANNVGPAVRVDVRHVVAMRHLDARERRGALVLARHGDNLVTRNQLLDRCTGLLRNALRILDDQLERPPEDAAGIVDHLHGHFGAIPHLHALGHGSGRRERDGQADFDGLLRDGPSAGE